MLSVRLLSLCERRAVEGTIFNDTENIGEASSKSA